MRSTCPLHHKYSKDCTDCPRYSRMYRQTRLRALREGTWARPVYVTGEELEAVRRHVRSIQAALGLGVRWVASTAGVGSRTVEEALTGKTAKMTPDVAEALLGVSAEACLRRITPTVQVHIAGTARRLQALAVEGWSSERLSTLLGIDPTLVRRHRGGTVRIRITWAHREQYRQLYEKIMAMPDPNGGSDWTTAHALARGYLPAERWAEEDIDDPLAEPLPPEPDDDDWVETTKTINRVLLAPVPGAAVGLPRAIQREIAKRARRLDCPLDWEQIAALMGFKSASTAEYLVRGRPDRPPMKNGRTK